MIDEGWMPGMKPSNKLVQDDATLPTPSAHFHENCKDMFIDRLSALSAPESVGRKQRNGLKSRGFEF